MNFLICLKAVLPIFIYLVIGMLVRRAGLLDEGSVKKLNRMVFIVMFPPLMFENLYGKDLSKAFDPKVVLYAVFGVLAAWLITWIASGFTSLKNRPKTRGVVIQAVYRSNVVLMGIPITMNIYGKGDLSLTAVVIAIVVPMYNVLAVITLEYFGAAGKKGNRKAMARTVGLGILKNPLIIGAAAGLIANFIPYKIPDFAGNIISDLGACATPISLLLLGASFRLDSLKGSRKELIFCVSGRLLLVPGILLTAAALLGFRDVAFVTLLSVFSAPAAVSSYTMAEVMGCDGVLAGNTVIFSSALASLTMFLWLFLFKSLGMF